MGEKAAREADPFSLSLPLPEQLFSLKFNCKVIARGWRFMEVEFHEFKTTSFLKKKFFHSFSSRLPVYVYFAKFASPSFAMTLGKAWR